MWGPVEGTVRGRLAPNNPGWGRCAPQTPCIWGIALGHQFLVPRCRWAILWVKKEVPPARTCLWRQDADASGGVELWSSPSLGGARWLWRRAGCSIAHLFYLGKCGMMMGAAARFRGQHWNVTWSSSPVRGGGCLLGAVSFLGQRRYTLCTRTRHVLHARTPERGLGLSYAQDARRDPD